jgi:hypothetical protein
MKYRDKPVYKIALGIFLMVLEIATFILLYSYSKLPTLLIFILTIAAVIFCSVASIKLFLNAIKQLEAASPPSLLNKISGYSLGFVIVCDSCVSVLFLWLACSLAIYKALS